MSGRQTKTVLPKPIKPIRRWCIARKNGALIESGFGDILNLRSRKTAMECYRKSAGERVVLMEMREVQK